MSARILSMVALGGVFALGAGGCEKKKAGPEKAAVVAPQVVPAKPVVPSQVAPKPSVPAAPEAAKAGAGSGQQPSMTADQALGLLKEGNARFIKGERKQFAVVEDRKRLVKGQHPHTIVLSCADSRVPPELVFDEGLGELFVVRVAGEALDSKVVASIEYAAANLGPAQLVVMGHEHCGAVAASLKTRPGTSAGSADLDSLVDYLRPRAELGGKASGGYVLEAKSKTRYIAADLVKRSAILRDRVAKGKLRVASALYHLESGEVEFFQ